MATGTSVFLIALGAILTFAVDVTVGGLDLDAVGIILMIAGAIGLAVSLMWIGRSTSRHTEHRVIEDRPVSERRVVDERVSRV